ncbi:MAG: PEP-CTERM sorting domain-containing protein [Akkermansiaceae bacterium]
MKKTLTILSAGLMMTGAAQAVTTLIDFNNLNNADVNTLDVGGVTTDLTVVRSTVTVSGADQYHFAVSYMGADFDGDTVNDTLTFNFVATGMSGNTVSSGFTVGGNQESTTGSVALDGAAASLGTTASTFHVGATNMNAGETLIFTIDSLVVSGTTGPDVYGATFTGFDRVLLDQTSGTGNSHLGIVGSGTDLLSTQFGTNKTYNVGTYSQIGAQPLYISSDAAINDSTRPFNWGVGQLDFGVTVDVVPEPSSTALLGLGFVGLLIRRKR